jgi:hypothetical protein
VEYGWLHTRSKYYLEIKTLREHCGWLDCFQGQLKPILDDLNRLYADLSTAVHSTSSKTLVLRQALDDIRLSADQTPVVKKDLHAVLKSCLCLCIFSEYQTYVGLHVNVQEFFKNVLSVREKTRLERALIEGGFVEAEVPPAAVPPTDAAPPADAAPPTDAASPAGPLAPVGAVPPGDVVPPADAAAGG